MSPSCRFFFVVVRGLRDTFPSVFAETGSGKLHSDAHRQFGQKWNWTGIAYQMADEKIEKVAEVYQQNLLDALQFLSYLSEKAIVDEQEDKFQERLRKAKRGR